MKPEVERRFEAIGIDHITFAVYDREYWKRILERIGFASRPTTEERYKTSLSWGGVNVELVSPIPGYHYHDSIRNFLKRNGEMQVYSVAVRVDDLLKANLEFVNRGHYTSAEISVSPDAWGPASRLAIDTPHLESEVNWELVQRPPKFKPETICRDTLAPVAVDHLALAVKNLKKWESFYHALGFKTIYAPPDDLIHGEYSGMKTVAVRRGGWTVALVEGTDGERISQVSAYADAHGNHSVQHAALRFEELPPALAELQEKGARFRFRKVEANLRGDLSDIMHEGKDHSGRLLQAFTEPFNQGGFFFETIQRLPEKATVEETRDAFDDGTVIGLYESIENEEISGSAGLIFPEAVMRRGII